MLRAPVAIEVPYPSTASDARGPGPIQQLGVQRHLACGHVLRRRPFTTGGLAVVAGVGLPLARAEALQRGRRAWARRRAADVASKLAPKLPFLDPVRRVAVVGGTHGNELNGIALARHFREHPEEVQRASFVTEVVIANEDAVERNIRYVDTDLNRCFGAAELASPPGAAAPSEAHRARKLNQVLGPKGKALCDVIVDMHNTTSNCGVGLMMAPGDDLAHEIALHLRDHVDPELRVVEWPDVDDWPMLPTCARSGFTLEAGPVAQGCLDGELYLRTRRIVLGVLDFLERRNTLLSCSIVPKRLQVPMAVYRRVGVVHYPVVEGKRGWVAGMVHPDLQGSDFSSLEDGDALFLMLDGSTEVFRRSEHDVPSVEEIGVLFPLFINEAAYFETSVALALAKRSERLVDVIDLDSDVQGA